MKIKPLKNVLAAALCALILMIPSIIPAQTEQSQTEQSSSELPPIEQQLVREGDLAMKLAAALVTEDAGNEAEAENLLAETGITPKNGWLADYPVTPDIAGELREGVIAAADAGKISLDRQRALQEFDAVLSDLGLPMVPHPVEIADETPPEPAESYVEPDTVSNYYYSEGPPVVTYYPPPPSYIYLYSWVPYPFWTWGYLFPGFFILNDFHRTVIFHRRTFFISNHFRDIRTHRVFRVHPRTRHRGHVYGVSYRNSQRSLHSRRSWAGSREFSDRKRSGSTRVNSTLGVSQQNSGLLRQPAGRRSTGLSGRSGSRFTTNSGRRVVRPSTVTPTRQNIRSFRKNARGIGRDTRRGFTGARSVNQSTRQVFRSRDHAGGSGRSSSRFSRGRSSGHQSHGGRGFSRSHSRGGRVSHGGHGRR